MTDVAPKFKTEKTTIGGITLLSLNGVVDHDFEGKKVAESIRTKKLIVNMREVARFASWGMSEWMDFLRISAERDICIVECSVYAVMQITLVTGLLGHVKLVSFYAPYRCSRCGEASEALMVVPGDRAAIREMAKSQMACPACGGTAALEDCPEEFFAAIAARFMLDLDDEILAFLQSHFKYDITADPSRFRAHRLINKGYTYIRLQGNLSATPTDVLAKVSQGVTVIDLAAINAFDPTQLVAWRAYVAAALGGVTSLQLLDCPPGFLEKAVTPEDLAAGLKIRTFALSYDCLKCGTTMAHIIDVAENLEQLISGTAPNASCPKCQEGSLVATLTREQAQMLRRLPARERDPALDKFLTKARGEPVERLEDCLNARTVVADTKAPTDPARTKQLYVYAALGLVAILAVGGLAVVAVSLLKQRGEPAPVIAQQVPVVAPKPTPTDGRPEWVMADVPSSAYCLDQNSRLMCVGVSSYRPTRNEAVVEATDAALEELVNTIGLKITDRTFRETIMPAYSEVRAKALAALQAADLDRSSSAYAAANSVVNLSRKRVAEILQSSGGAAVPSQRSDWYWEEYASEKGKGTEVLVFVRYDVTTDAVKLLIEKYSESSAALGTIAMTAFPALAWQYADFTGGARLTKVGKPLSGAEIAPEQIVMAVGEQRVSDATAFARRLEEWGRTTGDLKLTVKPGDGPVRVIDVKR